MKKANHLLDHAGLFYFLRAHPFLFPARRNLNLPGSEKKWSLHGRNNPSIAAIFFNGNGSEFGEQTFDLLFLKNAMDQSFFYARARDEGAVGKDRYVFERFPPIESLVRGDGKKDRPSFLQSFIDFLHEMPDLFFAPVMNGPDGKDEPISIFWNVASIHVGESYSLVLPEDLFCTGYRFLARVDTLHDKSSVFEQFEIISHAAADVERRFDGKAAPFYQLYEIRMDSFVHQLLLFTFQSVVLIDFFPGCFVR
jgi:hypothetical protein